MHSVKINTTINNTTDISRLVLIISRRKKSMMFNSC